MATTDIILATQPLFPELIAINRLELFETAVKFSGLYTCWWLFLQMFYAFLAGAVWQNIIGPLIVFGYPNLGQSKDHKSLSYLPTEPGHPYIVHLSFSPPALRSFFRVVMNSFEFAVISALLPELCTPFWFICMLALKFGSDMVGVRHFSGSDRTDKVFVVVHDLFLFAGFPLALQTLGLLH